MKDRQGIFKEERCRCGYHHRVGWTGKLPPNRVCAKCGRKMYYSDKFYYSLWVDGKERLTAVSPSVDVTRKARAVAAKKAGAYPYNYEKRLARKVPPGRVGGHSFSCFYSDRDHHFGYLLPWGGVNRTWPEYA